MLIKSIIVLLIIAMVASLFSALYFLVKDQGQGTRTVKALTWRISIWVILLLFIVISVYFGWLTPSNSLQRQSGPPQQSIAK